MLQHLLLKVYIQCRAAYDYLLESLRTSTVIPQHKKSQVFHSRGQIFPAKPTYLLKLGSEASFVIKRYLALSISPPTTSFILFFHQHPSIQTHRETFRKWLPLTISSPSNFSLVLKTDVSSCLSVSWPQASYHRRFVFTNYHTLDYLNTQTDYFIAARVSSYPSN